MNKKNFGLGIIICLALMTILFYGGYTLQAEEASAVSPDETDIAKPYGKAAKGMAEFINPQGENIGTAKLEENANGIVISLEASDLTPGYHAIHIHETGKCTPVEPVEENAPGYFTDSGSHLAGDNPEHGLLHEGGPHAGDLVNIYADENGNVNTQLFNDRITLQKDGTNGRTALLDADGSAFIIHSGTDDYKTQPTGAAGDRVACAVIKAE